MIKLTLLLLSAIFIWLGLSKLPFSRLFVVKQGKNFSKPLMLKIFLFFKPKEFRWKVSFDSTWRYDLANGKFEGDQLDINKIVGIGFLPWHHVYSIRFGARYNPEIDRVEIMPYLWRKGTRVQIIDQATNKELVLTNALMNNTEYECVLKINKDTYELSVYVDGIQSGQTASVVKGHNQFFGYLLQPYFGGNQKAPHDFNTKLEGEK